MSHDPVGPVGSRGEGRMEAPPKPDSVGQVGGRWHAPARFSAWLASQLRDDGKGLSAEVAFRPDGILVFLYRISGRTVPLFLVVGRRGNKGRLTRFGTLLMPVECPPALADYLIAHTEQRLNRIFPKDPPTWLRRRAQNVTVLGWGATFLQEFCYDLLLPGTTQWGASYLRSELFEPSEGLTLEIAGNPSLSLKLVPSTHPVQEGWVGQYGPLVLTLSDPTYIKHPFVNYIGYALSLLVPSNAKLRSFDENDGDWMRNMGDMISDDAFLIGGFRSHDENAKAFFGAKGNVICVGNLDRECLTYAGAPTGRVEGTNLDLWHVHISHHLINTYRNNDITDVNVVTANGEEELEAIVRDVLRESPELLVVQGGCASQLIGESSQRSLESAMAGSSVRVPCIAVDVCLEHSNDYRRIWDTLLEQTRPAKRLPIRRNSLNLVGYGHEDTPSMPELLGLLREVGIEDVQLLLPTFDMRRLPDFTGAAVTVVYPSPHVIDSFSAARRHCPTTPLFLDAPWGIAATLKWLNAILTAMGRLPLSSSQAETLVRRHLPSGFEQRKQEAQGKRVGFVCSRLYVKGEQSWIRHGLPLTTVLSELGLSLDLILLPSKRGLPLRLPPSVLESWGIGAGPAGRNRLIAAEPEETIEATLARAGSHVVYSEWEGDERVLGSGRPCFSWSDMRMGIEGSARNLRLLLRMASVPFFERYDRYFNQPPPRG